jgi:Na+/H+-dicarboxylate symporter
VWFVALLSAIAIVTAFVAPAMFASLTVDSTAAAVLRAQAAPTATTIPGFSAWLVGLVPSNPIKAAADGAMLPLILFAVLLALALMRSKTEASRTVADFFRAIADAMLVLVQWLLAVAPVGVFALAVVLAVRLGGGVAGAVAFYLVVHSALLLLSTAALYVVAVVVGRVPPGRFARALAPAQVVGFSTRSSVAALPAMLDGARRTLELPDTVAGFTLPFGVSIFRLNQAVSWVVMALFLGKLYGVPIDAADIALLSALCVVMSFSVPGIPSGSLFVVAPFFQSVGLPLEGIGILIALDAIPDVFKTLLNVTGHMTATVLVARNVGDG